MPESQQQHDPRCNSLKGGFWGCNCWSYQNAPAPEPRPYICLRCRQGQHCNGSRAYCECDCGQDR